MISITEAVSISKPPQDVFAFACNYHYDPNWRTGVVEVCLDPKGPPGLGTRMHEVMHFMGRRMLTTAEVVRYEPGREVGFRSLCGPILVEGYRRVEMGQGGTRPTYYVEARPVGVSRLLSPLMGWRFRRQLRADLQRLKRQVEGPLRKPHLGAVYARHRRSPGRRPSVS